MNRAWIILLLAAVAAVGFTAGRMAPARTVAASPDQLMGDVGRLVRDLGLNPEQERDVRRLNDAFTGTFQAACDRHCLLRCELARVIGSGEFRPEEARRLTEALGRTQAEADLATLDHILRLREILIPDQRVAFAKMFGSCLCNTCGAGGNCCAAENRADPDKDPAKPGASRAGGGPEEAPRRDGHDGHSQS